MRLGDRFYRADDELVDELRKAFAGAKGGFSSLGLDPASWIVEPQSRGTARVGGAETQRIAGDIDVRRLLADVARMLGGMGADGLLTPRLREQIADAVKSARAEVWTGVSDRIMRQLTVAIDFALDQDAGRPMGIEGGRVNLRLRLDGVNATPVEIVAPKGAKPLSSLFEAGGLGPCSAASLRAAREPRRRRRRRGVPEVPRVGRRRHVRPRALCVKAHSAVATSPKPSLPRTLLTMRRPSHVAIGTWSGGRYLHFGEPVSEPRLEALLRPGDGLDTLLTADAYGAGEADELLGRALRGVDRAQYSLVGAIGHDFYEGERDGAKGFPRFTDPALRGPDAYADYVRMATERSLERLGADAFDVLLLHNPDRTGYTSEVVWDALRAVRDEGLATASGSRPARRTASRSTSSTASSASAS